VFGNDSCEHATAHPEPRCQTRKARRCGCNGIVEDFVSLGTHFYFVRAGIATYIQRAYNGAMSKIRFEWDPKKAEANLRKHRVSFEEAQSIFADERALLIDDPDHSEDEDRFVLLRLSRSLRMLIVVHCYRAEGRVIRIISARKADSAEQCIYL